MRFLLPFLLLPCFAAAQLPALVPLPVAMHLTGGNCPLLTGPWHVSAPAPFPSQVKGELLALHPKEKLAGMPGLPIQFLLEAPDTTTPPEWYRLDVRPDGIDVTAPTGEGLFRGSRTLLQLLEQGRETGSLPCLSITDWPRFPWRGMHLDVCRHFFPVEFVKQYIDLLARYKMNSFHWHLTDDQGWRVEIKKYPKLTEVGAWRKGSQVGPYSRRAYDSIPYGGFYTQEQVREVVAYAAARHINVVPEIEMPGHALAALAAYPQLGCTGGPYAVQRGWGVFDDVFCAGNDSVFTVLEDVLTEVMGLFPGPYIHIGGDECPKERWKTCPKCQARMKAGNLKDVHELQAYFIRRIEAFVNGKGRNIIGWDEILEGGLAPNATVMSWRGTEGGTAAARSGHYAVMCPGDHCYFDHYQGDPANEPLAIGGYTPLQKVYSYEPVPAELSAEEAKYILGAQGNVWTEYILAPDHVEYMAVPRMLALAEVLWTPKDKRDEAGFIRRLEQEFPRLEEMQVNAAKSLYQVRLTPRQGAKPGTIHLALASAAPTGNGSKPILYRRTVGHARPEGPVAVVDSFYRQPLVLDRSCRVEGHLADTVPGKAQTSYPLSRQEFRFNKATARPITLSEQPDERYNEGGAFTLVDGITAQEKRVGTEWLGWRKSVTITVDLGRVQDIHYVGIGALHETYSWIHAPKAVEFSVSLDGKTFTPLGMDLPTLSKVPVHHADQPWKADKAMVLAPGRHLFKTGKAGKGRYVRIHVQHSGAIPDGFPGAGNPAWMFLDEVDVQ